MEKTCYIGYKSACIYQSRDKKQPSPCYAKHICKYQENLAPIGGRERGMLEQCYCAKCGEYMNIPVEFWGKYYHSWCIPKSEPPLPDLYPEMDEMGEPNH